MTEREVVSKQAIIDDLFFECSDRLVHEFFDYESVEKLDEKIDVLRKLNSGVKPGDIPNYYDVLEKYPKNGEAWD